MYTIHIVLIVYIKVLIIAFTILVSKIDTFYVFVNENLEHNRYM